jgi:hypothetical protein
MVRERVDLARKPLRLGGSSSTCETWSKCTGELDSSSPTLNDDVRSSTCMPPCGATKVSTRVEPTS